MRLSKPRVAAVTLGHILKLKREKKDDDYVWGVVIVGGLSYFPLKKWPLGRQCSSELAGVVAGNKLFFFLHRFYGRKVSRTV